MRQEKERRLRNSCQGSMTLCSRTMLSFEEAKAKLESAGQNHVLRFWPELSAEERGDFLEELSQLDPAELQRHCRRAAEAASRTSCEDERPCRRMEPVEPEFIGGVQRSDPGSLQEWEEEGLLMSYLHTGQNTVCFCACFAYSLLHLDIYHAVCC